MGSSMIILNLKHMGDSKIMSVNSSSSLAELKIQVTSKWNGLVGASFSFRYSIEDVCNCTIDSDLDLRTLIALCDLSSVKVVCVDVCSIVSKNYVDSVDEHNNMNKGASDEDDINVGGDLGASEKQGVVGESDHELNYGYDFGLNGMGPNYDSGGDWERDINANSNNEFAANSDSESVSDGEDVGVLKTVMPLKSSRIHSRSWKDNIGSEDEDGFDGIGSIPSYDVCPNIKKKPLLSDTWRNIMDEGVGTVFSGGAKEFRVELIKYSQQMKFRFKYTKNDKRYIYARCNEWEDCACQWHIKAKIQPVTNAFVVTKANLAHTCIGKFVGTSNRRLCPKIMGDIIVQDVKAKPHSGGKDIMDSLRIAYGIHVPIWKARRTREAAMNQIFGSYNESYDQLRWYCDAIGRTNPGSVVNLESDRKTNRFQHVFIAFKACLDGFKKCRPMLFIDGTFMTGRAKGTLLAATAKDGNNGLFPVAFAIVSAENKENWAWFLKKLREFVLHELQICYISDKNIGLMAAFPLVFAKPLHFFCLFHLETNHKGKFAKGWTNVQRENLCAHFKDCAYAPNIRLFNEKLAIFTKFGGKAAEEWVDQLPKEKWAVAYSLHIKRYGEMTSNAAEQFNAWIKEARSLPITHMIDHIRAGISRWILKRRQRSALWTGALCPRKEKLWNILNDVARSWIVVQCPSGKFEVLSHPTAEVDLIGKTCSCYQWQVRGFPCAHAAVVICRECPTVYNIVEECFLTKNYRACYSHDIHPIPESEKFEFQPITQAQPKILPPFLNQKPGRPRKKRKPSFGEYRKMKPKVTCSRCGNVANHDPTTCILQP